MTSDTQEATFRPETAGLLRKSLTVLIDTSRKKVFEYYDMNFYFFYRS